MIDFYWICGRNVYTSLPRDWIGCCAFVTLNTTMKIFPANQSQEVTPQRTGGLKRQKRSQFFKKNDVPVDHRRSARWDKFWGSLMPWIGASQNSHEIDRVAYELETLTNLTLEGFQIMQPELRAIRIMVMQNRMILDMLAEQGGVCHMVGEHCCTYIAEGDTNLTSVVDHMTSLRDHILAEHASDGFWDPFSWISSLFDGWGAKLFHWCIYGIVCLIAIYVCMLCLKKLH
ncbi:hypothetical protein AOXY_G22770 [Acipenser oxyrinchus oxyrinchus]|uniref:Envelope glycoprotein n=1 Tax=Acipenser oxyrinchus oxyrinchus TaxID=40147 RepID=A0AAD8CY47_ACIOX|nr:hypothetical protein AOXY_G22770 [Acipenser oxyrinchus oxyrinchus]